MNKQLYTQYIESDHWNTLKQKFEGLQTKCQFCGTTEDLDIHHRYYGRLWNENLQDLVRLCRQHHFAVHYLYKYMKANNENVSLTTVTDFLLKQPTFFKVVWLSWIDKQEEENDGWVPLNNHHLRQTTN